MTGLLADGWFYISSAGLIVSGILFFFLLGQYRAASEAADQPEIETAPAASEPRVPLVRSVWIPEEKEPEAHVASVPMDKPREQPAEAKPQPVSEAPEKRRDSSATGGVSPAVVYLQNMKIQIDTLHEDTRDLAKRIDAIAGRDEALIERLSELAQAVAELKSMAVQSAVSAPAPVAAPTPKRAKKIEAPAPEPEIAAAAEPKIETKSEPPIEVKPEPVIEAKPEPAVEAKLEPRIELKPEPVVDPKPETAGVELGLRLAKTEPEAKKVVSPDDTTRMELDAVISAQLSKATEKTQPAAAFPAAEAAPAAEQPVLGEKPRRGPVWPV